MTWHKSRLSSALLLLTAACRTAAPVRPPLEPDTHVTLPPRRADGALTQAERDALVRDLEAHRDAWRARHIADYRIQVAAGCFCPWPSDPAILEVQRGVAVALRDTTGKPMGAPREPWSAYTVEGLFESAVQAARSSDVVEVAYDPQYDYPAMMRGIGKVGLPDNWFWVKASRLTPSR
jgi:hypothetical protein